ncbi:extracellular solute-binding protein [Alicyclobacillus macrosporangiidus]|uniref:extracellular solute-binding protein n=1 Tax=Alicyclobacillus macrosporangiidus TaxID=392015 RepID=UPI0009DCB55B|nr:extracellular solute-binding protein [Alicyclobacillus macrosporangiidus]
MHFTRKVFTAVGGVGILTAGVVTACGNANGSGGNNTGNANDSKVTISIDLPLYNVNPQAQKDFMNRVIADFEKQNPNIKVNWQTYASASQENTTLQTSLATKQGPDIFVLGSTFMPVAYSTKAFHVLSEQDWNTVGGRSQFLNSMLEMAGPSPDQDIGVPADNMPYVMVYNKKMFQEVGISSPPKTWTEFIEDAKKLTNPSKNQWGAVLDPADPYIPWRFCWTYARELGGDFISHDLKTATLDSQASIQALQFWMDWVTKYKIASPNDLTYKEADAIQAFEQGHAAMLMMEGTKVLPALDSSPVKNDYAVAEMPTVPYGMSSLPPGGEVVEGGLAGHYYAIPNYVTGNAYQASLKFIGFMSKVNQQRAKSEVDGYFPVTYDAYKGYARLDTPMMKPFVEAANKVGPTPFSPVWGDLEVIYASAVSKITNELATNTFKPGDIEAVLRAANAQVQAKIDAGTK